MRLLLSDKKTEPLEFTYLASVFSCNELSKVCELVTLIY